MPQCQHGCKTFLAPPGSGTYNVPCIGTTAHGFHNYEAKVPLFWNVSLAPSFHKSVVVR